MGNSLLEYLKTHMNDLDNCLIGLAPANKILDTYYERTVDGKHYRLPPDVKPIRKLIDFLPADKKS